MSESAYSVRRHVKNVKRVIIFFIKSTTALYIVSKSFFRPIFRNDNKNMHIAAISGNSFFPDIIVFAIYSIGTINIIF